MRKKLISRRKKMKITQDQMAKKLGIARSTYAGYELGNFAPSLEIAVQIKKILKYYDDDIFKLNSDSKTNMIDEKGGKKLNE